MKDSYQNVYQMETHPVCQKEAMIQGDTYRISILTPWLMRLEYSSRGVFEDRATQCVINREFPVPEFEVFETADSLKIVTEGIQMLYDKKPFSRNGLSLQVRGNVSNYRSIWRYGEEVTDLKGTARTLDGADGAIALEHGVISRNGFSVIDDSRSLLLTPDGWVEPRDSEKNPDVVDIYFFGYGHQYERCLRDFYHLTGNTPLLPRFALGNWWSRYHRYSEEEYKGVVSRFEKEQVPFSVSVIDMDWHLVDIDPKYGSGWTGYTWNKELFPDPAGFMGWLHAHNLKVTLNVHPADGVRAHEDAYQEMARALGKDWEKEEAIEFDIADPKFLEAYFTYLHHPNEEDGVDFWWVDWQQGGMSKIPGLDPLWMLNHYHYLDSKRTGGRGLTFSRYAGLGSHRYPIGFSGDTVITWESLDFQPYFTANASNAGYGWWSHDIGGHMNGYKDDELSTRWLQFGVFSPILRLHSSCNHFTGKEPWNYNLISERVMKRYLKLRHELVPYLYTMNYYASREGQPLIRPMYYLEPEVRETYEVPNEYYFGTELIACPITKPMDKKAGAAGVTVWLPEGRWFDIFNGRVYDGGRKMTLYRGIEDIPVLARAGGIVPMAVLEPYTNSIENPASLRIKIFPGKNGEFHLYEDDGQADGQTQNFADTVMKWQFEEKSCFVIEPPTGDVCAVPKKRTFHLEFYAVKDAVPFVLVDGKKIEAKSSYCEKNHILTVCLPDTDRDSRIEVKFDEELAIADNDRKAQIFDILYCAEMEYNKKERFYQEVEKGRPVPMLLSMLQTMEFDAGVYGRISEVLLAQVQ
ncbi:MAG: glycoside hydrolase family 31 protein [bacterium]|nr:glycoside hydrolase family 31 protein [bacterium]